MFHYESMKLIHPYILYCEFFNIINWFSNVILLYKIKQFLWFVYPSDLRDKLYNIYIKKYIVPYEHTGFFKVVRSPPTTSFHIPTDGKTVKYYPVRISKKTTQITFFYVFEEYFKDNYISTTWLYKINSLYEIITESNDILPKVNNWYFKQVLIDVDILDTSAKDIFRKGVMSVENLIKIWIKFYNNVILNRILFS